MQYNFEIFAEEPVEQNGKRVHVTLNRRGIFFLNRKAIEALGGPGAVFLMYDGKYSVIGITSAPLDKANAYRLRSKDQQQMGGRLIYAANFCRHYAIRTSETLAFPEAEVNKDGILILDLNKVKPAGK